MLRTTFGCLALAGVLFAIGCSDERGSTPTTTPTASLTVATRVPPIIDKVIEATITDDPTHLQALIKYSVEACTTTPPGGGGPIVCETTEPNGTELEGIRSAACEAPFVRKDRLDLHNAVGAGFRFYGAFRFDAFPDGAKYIVIFERPDQIGGSTGMGIIVDDERVIGLHYGCGWAPNDFVTVNHLGTPVATPN